MEEENNEVFEPEVMEDEAVEKFSPRIPVTIDELSNLPDEKGVMVVKARKDILDNLRRASIAMTSPSDWLLFRNREGAVTAYCQDTGTKRFWQLWGIEITPKGDFEKITDERTKDFAYRCVADGFCKVTGLFVHDIEGIRYSTEDFCKDVKPEIKKEMFVRLAAVANRDGNIIRSLTGTKSVAAEFLDEVWKGTGKTTDMCSKGKGYGTQAERHGAEVQQSDLKPEEEPKCEKCGGKMRFFPAGESKTSGKPYPAFWSCIKRDCKYTIKHSEVLDRVNLDRRDQAESEREPGQEG